MHRKRTFMKQKLPLVLQLITALFTSLSLYAQDSANTCKVVAKELEGTYVGECKKGLAQGKGEALGTHRYIGNFKYGLPHGEGIYYYAATHYHKGKFQEGIKEGKGETHYLRNGQPDSVVKGYWSGDEYRGKNYITYNFFSGGAQMSAEIEPISDDGKTIEIWVAGSTGASGGGFNILDKLISTDGSIIRQIPTNRGPRFLLYEVERFPVNLQLLLIGGKSVRLDLYKKARWSIRLLVVQ